VLVEIDECFVLIGGAPTMFVATVQELVKGLNMPPVLSSSVEEVAPPQMIILPALLFQIAVWSYLGVGAPTVFIVVQVFVEGLYMAPVFTGTPEVEPPQMITLIPSQTIVKRPLNEGAFIAGNAVQVLVEGLYRRPEPKLQNTISVPVQTPLE